MKIQFHTDSRGLVTATKSAMLGLAAAAVLTACGGTSEGGMAQDGLAKYEVAGDHSIGDVNAPITVVEYASVTCSACANWHEAVWPDIRKDYIDTGKVRFIYREFPTAPQNLAMAGFLIANCASEDQYFANIGLQYERQRQLVNSLSTGRAAQEYQALAKTAGLSEKAYDACLANEDERAKLEAVIIGGQDAGVRGTPAFFINGKVEKVYKIEDFDKFFAEHVEVPERAPADEAEAAPEH
ncbi:MAG: thioredoxin domain-containing protein [Robiginitomaculum sp.]